MVEGIKGSGGTGAVTVSPGSEGRWGVRVRRRGTDHRSFEEELQDSDGQTAGDAPMGQPQANPARRQADARRAAHAYGDAGAVSGDPSVVMSRAAAILGGGDLDAILRRAGQSIRQLSETLLGVDADRTEGLVDAFQHAALDWVRAAIAQSRSYAADHESLPIGLSFEDVRVSVDAGHGGLAIDVGGVHFRRAVDFRARGVVFDIRGSSAVRRPSPGFFVDTGETGAHIANAIVKKVRNDLPRFGISEDTGGVCVLIRAEASDFDPARSGGWVIDFDILVPFDPSWTG